MAAWPGTLPSEPLINGYEEGPPNTTLRTQMDAGPAKVRNRYSAGVREIPMTLLMTSAQISTLDSFIVNDLSNGTEQIQWTHPRTGASVDFRIVPVSEKRLVSWQNVGGGWYRVQMMLEVLP